MKASRFPHTVLVEPTEENGLLDSTVFLAFQVMPVNKEIVESPPLGRLSSLDMGRVTEAVRNALGLQ